MTLIQSMAAQGLIRFPEAPGSRRRTRKPAVIGPRRVGNRFPQKLTPDQVLEIRRRWASHERVKSIAAEFGVTFAYVSMIGTGRRRASVQSDDFPK